MIELLENVSLLFSGTCSSTASSVMAIANTASVKNSTRSYSMKPERAIGYMRAPR